MNIIDFLEGDLDQIPENGPYYEGWRKGLEHAIDILRSHHGLWLEECDYETAQELAAKDKLTVGIAQEDGSIKFYRLPQAKEEK